VIRAPELIAEAAEWERLTSGERLEEDEVSRDDFGQDRPEWAK
jgi:hypothetical protein